LDRTEHRGGQDDPVPRTLAFVALWLLAGAAATTVAWLGVSSVSDELAGSSSHPDPLTGEEIRAEVAAAPSTTTSAPTTTTPIPVTSTTTSGTTPSTGVPGTTSTTTTVSPPAAATTRSYDLIGGTVTLRFSPSGVSVVVATPSPGFSVEIGDSHDTGKKVEFEGEDHKSRVEGWWDGGPQDEVREEADD
jgi:hypothetical protein